MGFFSAIGGALGSALPGLSKAWQGLGSGGGFMSKMGDLYQQGAQAGGMGSQMGPMGGLAGLLGMLRGGGGQQPQPGSNEIAEAMVGTTTPGQSQQPVLTQPQQGQSPGGGQWGYNPNQAGMKGLQNMQGLLGQYFGGGGYKSGGQF